LRTLEASEEAHPESAKSAQPMTQAIAAVLHAGADVGLSRI
jgi:hypothetical protein